VFSSVNQAQYFKVQMSDELLTKSIKIV
jgi:hypothetical protein